ncbi:hypothetical protein QBC35DRAFT_130430 [Podospora australis]|uniref:Rhodopsin domain-containing protein n=1 Tax=Podospora australis TaxID=1536484 RepID=A0AAN6WKK2_9PEZI|nr:hypothetical protein QBC35DRAFT_130430 [Podospora australis]
MTAVTEKYPGWADENRSHWVMIPSIIFTVVCPLLFGLRLWARKTTTGIDMGDWIGVAALVFALITNFLFFGMVRHGFGKHFDAIPYEDSKPALFLWWFGQATYKVSLHLTKVSLLLLYMRIFSHVVWFRRSAVALIVFLVAYMIASSIAGLAQCTPVQLSWDKKVTGKCVDLYVLFNCNGIVSMVTDVIVLVLPFPLIYGLNLPRAQKFALVPVFGLGTIIVVASTLRVYSLITGTTRDSDRTYDILGTLWTIIEYNLALICASLPSVRVLLVKALPKYFRSSAARSEGKSGRSGASHVRTWPSKVAMSGDGWSRVGNDGVHMSNLRKGRKGETDSQEVILEQVKVVKQPDRSDEEEDLDIEMGGIKKTIRYDVEFESIRKSHG